MKGEKTSHFLKVFPDVACGHVTREPEPAAVIGSWTAGQTDAPVGARPLIVWREDDCFGRGEGR